MVRKEKTAVFLCVEVNEDDDETAFDRFMECVPPLDALDDASECMCLRRATAKCRENETEVERMEGEKIRTAAGEWSGAISFEIILNTVHVVWANIAVLPLTAKLQ